MKKLVWFLFVGLALIIGLYPSIYFIIDREFGLLGSKSDELLTNLSWNITFYIHIILGAISLLIGWSQFSLKFRIKYKKLHILIGKIYIFSSIASGICGIYIALFATGGWIASIGFICLGIVWVVTTTTAYHKVIENQIEQHKELMIYSYAVCFATVTLKIWLPVMKLIVDDFIIAYRITAWMCWLPNIFIANFLIKRKLLKQ